MPEYTETTNQDCNETDTLPTLHTTSYTSAYPLSEEEEIFKPIFEDIKDKIGTRMTRQDVHSLLRKEIDDLGEDTNEGKFVNKLLHYTLLQEALSFRASQNFRPYFSLCGKSHILDNLAFFSTGEETKETKKYLKLLKQTAESETLLFRKHYDSRIAFQEIVDNVVPDKTSPLYERLTEFTNGQIFVSCSPSFIERSTEKALSSVEPEDYNIIKTAINSLNRKEAIYLFEIISQLNRNPVFKDRPDLLEKLKTATWKTITEIKRESDLNRQHSPITAQDRLNSHSSWKKIVETSGLIIQKQWKIGLY